MRYTGFLVCGCFSIAQLQATITLHRVTKFLDQTKDLTLTYNLCVFNIINAMHSFRFSYLLCTEPSVVDSHLPIDELSEWLVVVRKTSTR